MRLGEVEDRNRDVGPFNTIVGNANRAEEVWR